jgi:lipoate-protein ligase A
MAEKWRILGLDVNDAFMNMAVDEAICRLRSRGASPNTIRLYRWKPSAVSIGYFQILEQEVDVEACRRLGVDIVRRMTGGGAVYHAYEGEVTYSVIVDEGHPNIPHDIIKSYEVICGGVVEALNMLGLKAAFRPINDIDVGGRKISGNAQTRRWGVVLQHGTILVDADVRTMFTVLRVSKEKISDKLIKSAEERVTTIRRELGRCLSFEEVADALKEAFPRALGVEVYQGLLSGEERSLAERLSREKYSNPSWVRSRPTKGV